MKTKPSKADKLADTRVEAAYYASCSNVAINILDIRKVFAVGRVRIAAGDTDEQLQAALRAFVDTIRVKA